MTERQADQKWVEDTRAEYLARTTRPEGSMFTQRQWSDLAAVIADSYWRNHGQGTGDL